MSAIAEQLEQDAARLHAAAAFWTSPAMVAQVKESVRLAVIECDSPWLDRAAAAARWHCSTSEIDRISGPETDSRRVLTRHARGGTPMFLKEEGDAAIREGLWRPAGKSKAEK